MPPFSGLSISLFTVASLAHPASPYVSILIREEHLRVCLSAPQLFCLLRFLDSDFPGGNESAKCSRSLGPTLRNHSHSSNGAPASLLHPILSDAEHACEQLRVSPPEYHRHSRHLLEMRCCKRVKSLVSEPLLVIQTVVHKVRAWRSDVQAGVQEVPESRAVCDDGAHRGVSHEEADVGCKVKV